MSHMRRHTGNNIFLACTSLSIAGVFPLSFLFTPYQICKKILVVEIDAAKLIYRPFFATNTKLFKTNLRKCVIIFFMGDFHNSFCYLKNIMHKFQLSIFFLFDKTSSKIVAMNGHFDGRKMILYYLIQIFTCVPRNIERSFP